MKFHFSRKDLSHEYQVLKFWHPKRLNTFVLRYTLTLLQFILLVRTARILISLVGSWVITIRYNWTFQFWRFSPGARRRKRKAVYGDNESTSDFYMFQSLIFKFSVDHHGCNPLYCFVSKQVVLWVDILNGHYGHFLKGGT